MGEARKELDSFTDQIVNKISDESLAYVLKEYLRETDWEGFSHRDLTGIRRFFGDFLTYHSARGG